MAGEIEKTPQEKQRELDEKMRSSWPRAAR